ncbi:hypothetical protein E3U43_008934, partial [Larimichthys crocea]
FDVPKCFLRRILGRFLTLSFLKDEAAQWTCVLKTDSFQYLSSGYLPVQSADLIPVHGLHCVELIPVFLT